MGSLEDSRKFFKSPRETNISFDNINHGNPRELIIPSNKILPEFSRKPQTSIDIACVKDDYENKIDISTHLGPCSKKKLSIVKEVSSHSEPESEYSFYCPQLLLLANVDKLTHPMSEETIAKSHATEKRLDECEPPSCYGLGNCKRIIPEYYFTNNLKPGKLFDIDYYFIIKDDIKNFRPLSSHQIQYIKDLDDEHKDEIIELFNKSMTAMVDTFKSCYNSRNNSTKCPNITHESQKKVEHSTIIGELMKDS